jgi:hypothetical protein
MKRLATSLSPINAASASWSAFYSGIRGETLESAHLFRNLPQGVAFLPATSVDAKVRAIATTKKRLGIDLPHVSAGMKNDRSTAYRTIYALLEVFIA